MGQILWRRWMTNNIMKTFKLATPEIINDGVAWYSKAKKACRLIAKDTGLRLEYVVGAVSALSPNNKWNQNVIDARKLCEVFVLGGDVDSVKVCTYGAMKRKALIILELSKVGRFSNKNIKSILSGQKITAFYECIMGEDSCCIDGHAKNIYTGVRYNLTDPKTNVTKGEFKVIRSAYIDTAKAVNKKLGTKYKAYHIQAITWVAWRIAHGIA
tara:strand:- start:246 stop:884 length:639 start_codon:yes stop_codon:yes gene_type:complete